MMGRFEASREGSLYRTIVVDPPWQTEAGARNLHDRSAWPRRDGGQRSRELAYSTLAVEEIASLPVGTLADTNAHLYVWTINAYVEQTYGIARAWGFKPSTLLVWCKAPKGRGLGGRFSTSTEYILFASRGSFASSARCDRNWWSWPRSVHSAKPEAFLDIVEQVSPGPYAELFARRARFGWDYPIGDQALGGVAA